MGRGAVDGQLGTDTDTDNHEADLVDQAVRQHPPEIIFNHRIEDRKGGHHRPDPDQGLGAGEGTGQGIDRCLGGKGGKKDRPADSRLGIGVREPGVHERPGTVEADAEEYKISGH